MKNIKSILPEIAPDKMKHFFWGWVVATIVRHVAPLFGLNGGLCACISGVVLGISVEVYDHVTGKGEFDLVDALYTAIPGTGYLFT